MDKSLLQRYLLLCVQQRLCKWTLLAIERSSARVSFIRLLFIIGTEILRSAIRQSSTIKGIDMTPGKIAKLAQYADDTTNFVKARWSIDNQSV